MRIEFDEKDKKYIENMNKYIEDSKNPTILFEKDKKYYLEITCSDVAKANRFITTLLYHDEELKDTGIKVTAVHLTPAVKRELKESLLHLIDKVDNML